MRLLVYDNREKDQRQVLLVSDNLINFLHEFASALLVPSNH